MREMQNPLTAITYNTKGKNAIFLLTFAKPWYGEPRTDKSSEGEWMFNWTAHGVGKREPSSEGERQAEWTASCSKGEQPPKRRASGPHSTSNSTNLSSREGAQSSTFRGSH